MQWIASAATLLLAATLTPGPNNLLVMHAVVNGGLKQATRHIVGVLLGTVVLQVLITLLATGVFAALPGIQRWAAAIGALYLAALGVKLIAHSGAATHVFHSGGSDRNLGVIGAAAFQLLNPKSWVLVLTLVATADAGRATWVRFTVLAALTVPICAVALLLWALLGSFMMTWLRGTRTKRHLNRAMGAATIVAALWLGIESLVTG